MKPTICEDCKAVTNDENHICFLVRRIAELEEKVERLLSDNREGGDT